MICHKPTKKYPDGRTGTYAGARAHDQEKEPRCSTCSEAARLYDRNRELAPRLERARAYKLRNFYQMAPEDYEILLAKQNFCCAICDLPISEATKRFAIDHDHFCCSRQRTCGFCIRGLLCENCNRGTGLLGDDPSRLRKAADYVERNRK